MALGLDLEERHRLEVLREAVDRPDARKWEHRAALLLRLMQRRVVDDVLADALLVPAVEDDDGRLAQEVCTRLHLEPLQLVPVDLEAEVLDALVQAHRAANATATSAASRALATMSARLTSRVRPSLRSWRKDRTNGVTSCPDTPCSAAAATASSMSSSTSRLSGGGFPRSSPAPPSSQCAVGDRGGFGRLLHALRDAWASVGGVEERQGVRSKAEHGDGERLQHLDRCGHVQKRLDAGGHDQRGRASESRDVSGHVRRGRVPAVHAADASRPEKADADERRDRERTADRRRSRFASDRTHREVARARLPRVRCEANELVRREADPDLSVEDADRRRRRARRTHRLVALEPDLDADRRREPVRDERRLERDDGPALVERRLHLLRDRDERRHGIDPSRDTQRAAASSARSGPPTM